MCFAEGGGVSVLMIENLGYRRERELRGMARKTSGKGDRRLLIYPPYYLHADSKE